MHFKLFCYNSFTKPDENIHHRKSIVSEVIDSITDNRSNFRDNFKPVHRTTFLYHHQHRHNINISHFHLGKKIQNQDKESRLQYRYHNLNQHTADLHPLSHQRDKRTRRDGMVRKCYWRRIRQDI